MISELAETMFRISPDIKAYYRFEGNSTDEIGSVDGSDTSVSYGMSYGKFNNGGHFSGSSYINFGDNFDLTGDFTVSAWVKCTAGDTARRTIISKGSSNHYQWEFTKELSGQKPVFRLYQAGGNAFTQASGPDSIDDSQWHHVLATYDASETALKLYVDGEFKAQNVETVGTYNANDTAACWVGGRASNSNFWVGDIDDLAIFNKVLSENEVKQLYSYSTNFLMFD